jgi:hypothetical protein
MVEVIEEFGERVAPCSPNGEKLGSLSQFIVRTQGLAEAAARTAAKGIVAKLPAWKDIPVE